MTKQEMIMEAVASLGYVPQVDPDGDVLVRYQLKNIYVLVGQEDDPYVSVMLPQLAEVEEGEEKLALAICNKLTRDLKLAKLYLDHSLKSVSASCEFYYSDMENMMNSLQHALTILGLVTREYVKNLQEFGG